MAGIDHPILLDMPERLDGERITLRVLQDGEAGELFGAIQESVENLRPWMPWVDRHRTVDDSLEYIRRTRARFTLREGFDFGMFERGSTRYLGNIGFFPREWRVPSFEIGYWLRQSEQGKGYMTEGVRLLAAHTFNALGSQRTMIRCDIRNARSRAIPERLGFTLEGTLRRAEVDPTGEPMDMLIFSLLPDDYQRVRSSW